MDALTPEQIQRNRVTLANNLKRELGLSSTPSDWTLDEQRNYNLRFADFIQSHPQSFAPMDLQTAKVVQNKNYSALEDDSFDFEMFADESLNNGVAIVKEGGRVLENSTYIAVVGALIYFGVMAYMNKKATA